MTSPEAPDAHDVFISYHSGDTAFVATLIQDLQARNVRVWRDRDQLRPGDVFVQALEDAILKVPCLVVVVSRGSLRSRWVQEEVARALVLVNGTAPGERRLVAAVIDEVEPPGFLASRTWVNFRDPNKRAESLASLVFGITGRRSGTHATPAEVPPDAPVGLTVPRINAMEYVSRQIERTLLDVSRLRRLRVLGLVPGLVIVIVSWAAVHALPAAAIAGLLVGAPFVTALVAWGATHAFVARNGRNLETWEVLRDGLQLCHEETSPSCKVLRARFWQMVLRQAGGDAPSSPEQRSE